MSTPTTTPAAVGPPGYSETLTSAPESVRAARLLVVAALRTWDLEGLVEVGTLIVSELVTNSIDHTPCRRLRVVVHHPSRNIVRIGVADTSRVIPALGGGGSDREGGRGLILIDALAWRWGCDRHCRGKLVWAELLLPEDESDAEEADQ